MGPSGMTPRRASGMDHNVDKLNHTGSPGESRHHGYRWLTVLLAVLPTLGATCIQREWEGGDELVPRELPLATRFIHPQASRETQDSNGLQFIVGARTVVASMAQGTDLWITRGGTRTEWEPPRFLGVVPSCYGRSTTRQDPTHKTVESTCRLGAVSMPDDSHVLVELMLGGTWTQTLRVPLGPAFADRDNDGWNDALEMLLGTNPVQADTDGDGEPDPEDGNPLVAPAPDPFSQKELDRLKIMRTVVAELPLCRKGRPLIIMGPADLQHSFPNPRCQLIYYPLEHPLAAARSVLLPINGTLPTGDAVLRKMAVAGGIPRFRVSLDSMDPKVAMASYVAVAGTVRKRLLKVEDRWEIESTETIQANVPPEWSTP